MDWTHIGLLVLLTGFACVTVFLRDLVRSAISLALMSALLSVLLFKMNSPFAAVFELSVVAGLITVLFVSAIALTKGDDEVKEARWPLAAFPLALILFAVIDVTLMVNFFSAAPWGGVAEKGSFGATLWGNRAMDIMGQIAVIFGGVFGVLALLREKPKTAEEKAEIEKAKDKGEPLW
jgi:NADH-quinone oxidoreductase subunit J